MSDLSCHAIVTHDFIEDACGKPAAGFAMPSGQDEVDPWPACAYHLNRWGAAPIRDALAAAWDEGASSALHGPTTVLQNGVTLTTTATLNPYRQEQR